MGSHRRQGGIGLPGALLIKMTEAELAWLSQVERDAFEERAAIREYDGGFSRRAAELLAYREIIANRGK